MQIHRIEKVNGGRRGGGGGGVEAEETFGQHSFKA